MCSFDLWCFQSVLSTLTPSTARRTKKKQRNFRPAFTPLPSTGRIHGIAQPYRGNTLYHSGFSVGSQHARAPPTGSCETWGTLEPNSNEGIAVGDPLNRFVMFSDPGTHPTPKTYNFEKNPFFFRKFSGGKIENFENRKFSTKHFLADFFSRFFFVEFFSKKKFGRPKKIYFSKLNFFWRYNFDLEKCALSIYDVFRAFWAL